MREGLLDTESMASVIENVCRHVFKCSHRLQAMGMMIAMGQAPTGCASWSDESSSAVGDGGIEGRGVRIFGVRPNDRGFAVDGFLG